jgi:heme/copper-type cytochrome/quinol oxidase subunit 2
MPVLLADAAPTGTGLAIIAVILLAMFAVFVAICVFVTVKVVRFVRRRRSAEQVDPEPGIA